MAQALTSSGNVTNAGAATLTAGVITNGTGNITLQLIVTKVSGTVAGTAQPQYSLDGTNWAAITGASAFTLTDVASQTQVWPLQNVNASNYRILVTGSGTMVATPSGYILQDND